MTLGVVAPPNPSPVAQQLTSRCHCAYHLGDNLVQLNFLRRVALQNPDRIFWHAARACHIPQLIDLTDDVPNLSLAPLDHDPFYAYGNWNEPAFCKTSVNAWRGADDFWYSHPDRNDFVKFHVEHWFPLLAHRLKVDNPIKSAADMLFDYPALLTPISNLPSPSFDVLVINSAPGSGQFQGFDAGALGNIAIAMSNKGASVITTAPVLEYPRHNVKCTSDYALSVTQVGYLSLHCHTILMVSTGPSWATFNSFNRETVKDRIILIDSERVDLAPNTRHCNSILAAAAMLEQSGLL